MTMKQSDKGGKKPQIEAVPAKITYQDEIDELRQIKERLQTSYWTRHRALTTDSYDHQATQIAESVRVGKVAEAMQAINAAVSALMDARQR